MQKKKLEIIKYPNSLLRRKTRRVKNFSDPELVKLVSDMIVLLDEAGGVGLAATQVGSLERVCLVNSEDGLTILINPEIKSRSRKKEKAEEGCLSFPGQYFEIERSAKVKIRAQDLHGHKIKIKAQGFLARVLQHEIDHLDGKLLIDYLKKSKS